MIIKKFKELIEQQQKEKEMILHENGKIKAQLLDIKELFKQKLPELGLDPNMLDFEEGEEEEGEGQEQEHQNGQQPDSSTEDDS